MRTFQIEIVARAVKIDHEQVGAVEAVLLAVGLRLGDHHLLGEAVGGVGFFGIAVPEVAFLERHGRELGVVQMVPTARNFSTPASRLSSISWAPMSKLE